MKITVLCRDCGWMRDTDQEGYTVGLLYNQMLDHEAAFNHRTYEPVDPVPRSPEQVKQAYKIIP